MAECFFPSSGPFFTNQLNKTEEQQNYFLKEPGPNFGPTFKLNPFCGSVSFSQLWVFSVFTSAFPSLLLSNFQAKTVAPKSPSDALYLGSNGAAAASHPDSESSALLRRGTWEPKLGSRRSSTGAVLGGFVGACLTARLKHITLHFKHKGSPGTHMCCSTFLDEGRRLAASAGHSPLRRLSGRCLQAF